MNAERRCFHGVIAGPDLDDPAIHPFDQTLVLRWIRGPSHVSLSSPAMTTNLCIESIGTCAGSWFGGERRNAPHANSTTAQVWTIAGGSRSGHQGPR